MEAIVGMCGLGHNKKLNEYRETWAYQKHEILT
jgi:hypothetical protein